MQVFDKTMGLLEQSLNMRAERHKVIATNIANEETPGYRAKELHFLEELTAAAKSQGTSTLARTSGRHLSANGGTGIEVKGKLAELPTPDLPLDGNSVNLDLEMAKLGDNAVNYDTAATIVSMRFQQLMSAIRGSR